MDERVAGTRSRHRQTAAEQLVVRYQAILDQVVSAALAGLTPPPGARVHTGLGLFANFLKRNVIEIAGCVAVTSTCQWIVAVTRIRRAIIDVVARMDAHPESHCAAEEVWQQRATEGRGCRRQRCHRRARHSRVDPWTRERRLRRSVWGCSTHKRRYGRAGPDAGCGLIRQFDSLRPAGAAYHGAHRCAVSDRSSRELYELSDCTRYRRGGADRAGDPLSNLFLPSARCLRRSEYQLSDRPHILVGQLDGTGA